MVARNLYKIVPAGQLSSRHFNAVEQGGETECRRSLDGTKVIVKLPRGVQGRDDVPPEWLGDWDAFKPYLTHKEVLAELQKPEWTPEL